MGPLPLRTVIEDGSGPRVLALGRQWLWDFLMGCFSWGGREFQVAHDSIITPCH